ncbi:uncharacterized protein LOC144371016 isoform X3 [Ictidomys tridecemlineatus]
MAWLPFLLGSCASQAIPLLGSYPKDLKTAYYRDTATSMFTAAQSTIAKLWKQPRCPSLDEKIKKLWHLYTMEYYSALKENKIMAFAAFAAMGETELEVAVLEEMEREIAAWDKVEDTATEYLLEIWADELKEMKEVEKLDTIEKIRDWLGPEQLVGTALIFKRQQVWELKKHYSMDPFPSHSTLVALASRLGVEEQQVQDWFLIKQYFRSRPPEFSDNCFVHSGLDSHEPTLFCMFCTCPSPNGDQQSVPEEALPKRPWSLLVYGK